MLRISLPVLARSRKEGTRRVDVPAFRLVSSFSDIIEDSAVVIGRAGMKVPPDWNLITVSSVKGYFGPRELHRILDGIIKSLKGHPDRAVIIACPEYLALHNGFETFLRFLNTIRDHVILTNTRVYVVTDPLAWKPRQWALLKKLEL
ncbi:DUF835 domain-containing protein [Thermococcus sp. JdF3]|uniref:DUF835 domain-containing protein n=1 Tax=Thermococcus sp. JdF3 TaxID=1638258 RepID=UPI00143B0843|nr:DUF835 domain-containing protein [Thermococcus sp. JdF3]NJE00830.1 DUF835 domain-containing protein [Thermococcus sp. JdF3]